MMLQNTDAILYFLKLCNESTPTFIEMFLPVKSEPDPWVKLAQRSLCHPTCKVLYYILGYGFLC